MEFQVCYNCKRSFSLPKDWEWKCPYCELTTLRATIEAKDAEIAEDRECCTKSQEMLSERITALAQELAEARQAANSNKAAYSMAYERLTEYEARADAAEEWVKELKQELAAATQRYEDERTLNEITANTLAGLRIELAEAKEIQMYLGHMNWLCDAAEEHLAHPTYTSARTLRAAIDRAKEE